MSYIEKEKLIKADIESIENRVRHAFNQGYDLGFKEGKKRAKPQEQEPTTRNCFGCKYSKDNHNAGTEECHLCMWENQYTPTTKNDLGVDCISRADAIGSIAVECSAEKLDIDYAKFLMLRRVIKALPTVTPQPKSGRWITWKEAGNEIPSERRFECSVCHDAAQTLCNGLDLLSEFCPNCGARMVEPQESEG
jgi:hypothetical protein